MDDLKRNVVNDNWELGKDLEFVKRFLLLIIIIPTGAEGSMQVFMPKTADKLDHVAGMSLPGIQRLKKFIPSPGFFPSPLFQELDPRDHLQLLS